MTNSVDVEALQRQIAELQAQLAAAQQANVSGAGAVASGPGATAAGARAVLVEGNSNAPINTGTQIATQGGHHIGRDFIQIISQISRPGEDPAKAQSVIAHYLQALVADLAGLKLGEIDVAAGQPDREPLQLADVYVPLDTHFCIPNGITLAQWHNPELRRQQSKWKAQLSLRPVSALEALAFHRELTLLGNAGCGKSTFGANVLLILAQTWLGHCTEIHRLGEAWCHGALLPVRVVLRRFAEQLPSCSRRAHAGDLWDFIARDLHNSGYGLSAETHHLIQSIARDQGALILLDGLDECGSDVARERVLRAVDDFRRSAGPRCRFLLTARPYAFPLGANPRRGIYELAQLDDCKVKEFINAWYSTLVRRRWLSPGAAERKKSDLLSVWQRVDLERLARNPLLLTLMTTLHANRGRLPDDRAELYHESVDLLMLRWNRQIGADQALLDILAMPSLKLSDVRAVLEKLAFEVHQGNVGTDGTADIGEDRLVRAMCPLLNHSKDKADLVVDYIEKRAGLLIGQGERDGERQFTFPHRSFQEFLAACYLAAKDDFACECNRLARSAPGHWQVVLPLAARLAKPERGASAADALVRGCSIAEFRGELTAVDWICARLAGEQLLEIGLNAIYTDDRTRNIAKRVAGWLAASLPLHPNDGGASAIERVQAGDVLAKLGDLRFDPQRDFLPADDMLGFAHIPADPHFCMGTRPADVQRIMGILGTQVPENERSETTTPSSEYYIARYPVTVAQFTTFLESTGLKFCATNNQPDSDNRPARGISWFDAIGYCEWLNDRILRNREFDGCELARMIRKEHYRITLPSELEWEKAARGGRETVFAWGDEFDHERANMQESETGRSSAVGCFAKNDFGLYDMVGNVWEWTSSAFSSYPYCDGDGRENLLGGADLYRVQRGGSWVLRRRFACCTFRNWDLPDGRNPTVGFRLALRLSHPMLHEPQQPSFQNHSGGRVAEPRQARAGEALIPELSTIQYGSQ